jgi:hypothetical protein
MHYTKPFPNKNCTGQQKHGMSPRDVKATDHSHPSSTQVKNEWSYTPAPAIRFYGVDRVLHISKCRNVSIEQCSVDLNSTLTDVTLSPDPSHLALGMLCASHLQPGRGCEKKNFCPFREPNPGRPDSSAGTTSIQIVRFVK